MHLERLSNETHVSLRISSAPTPEFAASLQLAMITAGEFNDAALAHPIVFAEKDGEPAPCVVLGLEEGRNQNIGPDGLWRPHTYIPGVIRAYPFVPVDLGNEEVGICIDTEFTGWSTTEGKRLFFDDGSRTPFLDESVTMVLQGVRDTLRTREFTSELLRLGLLRRELMTASHRDGRSVSFTDFMAVDDEELHRLPGSDLIRLRDSGYLRWIHAHLISLNHMKRLIGELVDG
ncbi:MULTISPECIES: SapC family protein [unclassified Streptomyces]|uniref:SapC family protein n=1 Tax=unclassified Streptomyces TaxID=2593676 RepID=UPI003D760F1B